MYRLSIPSLLAALAFHPLSAQNTVLTTATCPVCTEPQKAAWAATHDSTIRLRPRDLLGHRIGLNRANTYSGKAKYRPILHEKQVGCGRFVSFGLYTNDKGEWDWNLRVRPTAYSQSMHDAIRNATPAEKLQEWPCNGDCFKGEVTTDNGFWDNPYFNVDVPYITVNILGYDIPIEPDVSKAKSILTTNDTLCMYGPWVQDLGHSDHAEIHPAEVIWWRDRATGAIYALILQEDSNRFDRQGEFRMDDQPNWSRPWAAFPRWTEIRVAFAADASGASPGLITVDDIEAHRILTKYNSAASQDSDDGSAHALEFNGNVVMNVTELEAPSDRIGVRFVDLCRLATDGGELIIGYVSLQTVIGDHDRGDGGDARDEGYYVVKITVDEPATAPTIAADFRGTLDLLRRFRTARSRADSTARVTAVADRPASTPKAPRITLSMPTLRASGTGSSGQSRGQRRTTAGAPTIVQSSMRLNARHTARIPMAHGGTVVVRDGQDSLVLRVPRLGLGGSVLLDSAVVVAADPRAADAIAARSAGEINAAAMGARLTRVQRRVVELVPEYVAARTPGSDNSSDESPLAEVINGAIHAAARGDRSQVSRLFGNAQPFTTSWRFVARNLVTGDSVSVLRGPAVANRIAVQVSNGSFANSRLTVYMPATGVFELTATALFTDVDGIRGSASHTVHSHELAADDVDELLSVIRDAGALLAADMTERATNRRQPRAAQGAVALSMARHAVADGKVTLQELEAVRTVVARWRAP